VHAGCAVGMSYAQCLNFPICFSLSMLVRRLQAKIQIIR
jgi:hypothetical protein